MNKRANPLVLTAAALSLAGGLWSCSFFHAELPGTACETPADCLSTETCELGQCVIPADAAPMIDARPPPDANRLPDADPAADADETPDAMETPDADPPDAS